MDKRQEQRLAPVREKPPPWFDLIYANKHPLKCQLGSSDFAMAGECVFEVNLVSRTAICFAKDYQVQLMSELTMPPNRIGRQRYLANITRCLAWWAKQRRKQIYGQFVYTLN